MADEDDNADHVGAEPYPRDAPVVSQDRATELPIDHGSGQHTALTEEYDVAADRPPGPIDDHLGPGRPPARHRKLVAEPDRGR